MGNVPTPAPAIVTGEPVIVTEEPEICIPTSQYEVLRKNSITLGKVLHANKIINDATEDFGDKETLRPSHHHDHRRKHSEDFGDREIPVPFNHHDRSGKYSESDSDDDGLEGYQYPQVIPNDLILKETGLPITSEVTKSFQQAKHIRSPYDKYWLNIYNNHAKKTDYNL